MSSPLEPEDKLEEIRILLTKKQCRSTFASELSNLNEQLKSSSEQVPVFLESPSGAVVLDQLIESGCVGQLGAPEDSEHTATQFKGCAAVCEKVFECLNILLPQERCESVGENKVPKTIKIISPKLFLLISANIPRNLWTNKKSEHQARLALQTMKDLYRVETCAELLLTSLGEGDGMDSPSSSLYHRYLALVRKNLTRELWKQNPSSKASFCWSLLQLKFPDLSVFLDEVLPFPLNMVDDFNIENKILGVKCLHHIIENVSREELRWYGRADVVFEALKHQMYTKHVTLIEVLHPAVLHILETVERTGLGVVSREVNRCDELLRMILLDAELENNLSLRRALTLHLHLFIRLLGLSSVRHMKTILQLLNNYLQIYDGPEEVARLSALRTLETLMFVCWPRIPAHATFLLKMLLRLLYDVCTDKTLTPESVKADMLSRSTDCLNLLQRAAPDVVTPALLEVSTTNTLDKVKDIALSVCVTAPS